MAPFVQDRIDDVNGNASFQHDFESLPMEDRNSLIFEALKLVKNILDQDGYDWQLADNSWLVFGEGGNAHYDLSVDMPPIFAVVKGMRQDLAGITDAFVAGRFHHPAQNYVNEQFVVWVEVVNPSNGTSCPVSVQVQIVPTLHVVRPSTFMFGSDRLQVPLLNIDLHIRSLVKLLASGCLKQDRTTQHLEAAEFAPDEGPLDGDLARPNGLYEKRIDILRAIFLLIADHSPEAALMQLFLGPQQPSILERATVIGYAQKHMNCGSGKVNWRLEDVKNLHQEMSIAYDLLVYDARSGSGGRALADYWSQQKALLVGSEAESQPETGLTNGHQSH